MIMGTFSRHVISVTIVSIVISKTVTWPPAKADHLNVLCSIETLYVDSTTSLGNKMDSAGANRLVSVEAVTKTHKF